MTEALTDAQRATLRRILMTAICPPRLYRTRESALGTVSYETLLRSRGPIGPLTNEQAQAAIIRAGLAMGVIIRTASGDLIRTF